ncbi:MAG: 50S ribosomal protein L21 [Spirochaetia bacterium]
MYAMVEIKGKQYKASEGSLLKVDKFNADTGDVVELDSVLMISSDSDVKIGEPFVKGAKIKAVIEGHGKEKKLVVLKFKRRKNYRKKKGHRQGYSLLRIKEIAGA